MGFRDSRAGNGSWEVTTPRRTHPRDLLLQQLEREPVFFADRGVRPALRAIELGGDRRLFVSFDAVHTVLVAVERVQRAGAAQTEGFDGVENDLGRERGVRLSGGHAGDFLKMNGGWGGGGAGIACE